MRGISAEYLLRRLFMFVLTVWIGATVIFIIPRLAPGDPIAAMVSRLTAQAGYVQNSAELIASWRKMFGLDDPIVIQYLKYLGNLLTFNLGYSLTQFPIKVQDMISQAMPWTIILLSVATIISFILGNAVGALMGWRRTPSLLKNLLPLALMFTAIPFFMLAILLIYVFAFGLRLFPVSGGYNSQIPIGFTWRFISDAAYHGILPAMSIVIASMGFWALGMRGMMITTAGEDYLILAQAKGLRPTWVFWRYAVRNAILPQVTAFALTFGAIVGGSTLVEYLFAYPGMGYLLYQGIVNQDYAVIQGICFILILTTALAVLIVDLIYPLVDPRITYQRK
jgi:peptide/nickel transport system permease protein